MEYLYRLSLLRLCEFCDEQAYDAFCDNRGWKLYEFWTNILMRICVEAARF